MNVVVRGLGVFVAMMLTSCGSAPPGGAGGDSASTSGDNNGDFSSGDLTEGSRADATKTQAECEKKWTAFVSSHRVGQSLYYEIRLPANLLYTTKAITESSSERVKESKTLSGRTTEDSLDKATALKNCTGGGTVEIGQSDNGTLLETRKENKTVRAGEFPTIYTRRETKLPSDGLISTVVNETWTSDNSYQIVIYRRSTLNMSGQTTENSTELLKMML